MKIEQTIILSVAIGLFIIGVHQSFLYGVMASYWLFMIVAALLLYYRLRNKPSAPKQTKKTVHPRRHS